MLDGNLTPVGPMKLPTISHSCEWVKNLWESVKHKTVMRSFKNSSVSSVLDGNENDTLMIKLKVQTVITLVTNLAVMLNFFFWVGEL